MNKFITDVDKAIIFTCLNLVEILESEVEIINIPIKGINSKRINNIKNIINKIIYL